MDVLWKAHIDGSAIRGCDVAGVGILIEVPSGVILHISQRLRLPCDDSGEAEYAALLLLLNRVLQAGCSNLKVYSDCEPMVRQIRGEYRPPREISPRGVDQHKRARVEQFTKMYKACMLLIGFFEYFEIEHILREENSEADALARNARYRDDRKIK